MDLFIALHHILFPAVKISRWNDLGLNLYDMIYMVGYMVAVSGDYISVS